MHRKSEGAELNSRVGAGGTALGNLRMDGFYAEFLFELFHR